MSATNHTPGPWSAWGTGRNWMIRGGAGQVAGNVAQTLPRPEFGQEAANARLIVKAPDMYELLEAVIAATTHESTKYILPKTGSQEESVEPGHYELWSFTWEQIVGSARRLKAEIGGMR